MSLGKVKPSYSLEEAKHLVQLNLVDIPFPSKSWDAIEQVVDCPKFTDTVGVLYSGFMKLETNCFHASRYYPTWERNVDVYGLKNHYKHNWYVKFCLSDESGETKVYQLSFHPLDTPMKIVSGEVLEVTWKGSSVWKT